MNRLKRVARTLGSVVGFSALAALLIGCPKTEFFNEASGQPGDRAVGKAPEGSVGVCKLVNTRRPPIVNEALWNHVRYCNSRTPRRYVRLGYDDRTDEGERMRYVMEELAKAATQPDGNVKMLQMLRAVKRLAASDEKLKARVERAESRTFACDYAYLLNTTRKHYTKVSVDEDPCPAYAYDPKLRRDVCLFDLAVAEAQWLTSSWSCLGFTETVGEGGSCHRVCAYDDYCAGQVSCSQADFDLALCALGVCMPEKVQTIF